jgi:hypothetical protein
MSTIASLSNASGAELSYTSRWNLLSSEYDALMSKASSAEYESAVVPVHNEFWAGIYAKCGDSAAREGIREFRAIAVVDSFGTIVEFLPMPNMRSLECFVKEMVGKHYPSPPSSPFLVRYSIRIADAKSN